MTSQIVKVGSDSWADEAHAGRTHGGRTSVAVRADSGASDEMRAFMWLRCPAIIGDFVPSATLRLTMKTAGPGQTFTAERINESWKQGSLDWNNQPSVTSAGSATVTVASVTAGDVVELDVSSIYQSAANGAKFYGVRITTDQSTTAQRIYSLDSEFPPSLEITYHKAPQQPTAQVPAGVVSAAAPVVACDFTDKTGNDDLSKIQVQADPAASETSPAFDSGWVTAESPELDLSTTAFVALSSGASTQWRVRVQNEAGYPSPWSDWVTITYQPLPSLTITNPSGGAAGSPTFEATATLGTTATFWRIRITDGNDRTNIRYDTGKRKGATIAAAIPAKWNGNRVVKDGGNYQIQVQAWDAVDGRVAAPGAPAHATAWATFAVVDDASTPPDSVTATLQDGTPIVVLQWHRATEPDSWVIHRDGEVIGTPDITEVTSLGGGVYQWTEVTATPQTPHVWKVKAVTDGSQSAGGVTGSVTLTPLGGVWLVSEDGTRTVCVRRSSPTGATNTDQASTYQTVGSRRPFRIITALTGRAYPGFSGTIEEGIGGRTMAEWRDDALAIKGAPTESVRLVQGDENLLVQVSNMSVTTDSTSTPARPVAAIKFDYQQVGEFEYGGRV